MEAFRIIKHRHINWLVIFLSGIMIIPEPVLFKYRFLIWPILGAAFIYSYARNFKIAYFLNSYQDALFLLYLFTLLLSFYFAVNHKIALPAYLRFSIPPLFIYYIFKNESHAFNKNMFINIFILLGSVVSMLAISEFILHKNIIYEHLIDNYWYKIYIGHRAMSTFMMPAILGTYLLTCISMSFYGIYNAKSRYKRYAAFIVLMLCFSAMLLTFSRGTLIGFIVMVGFYFYNKYKRRLVFLLIFILLAVIIFIGSSSFVSNINSRLSLRDIASDYIYTYKASRAITTFKMLKDHPFTGVGLDNYRYVFDRYHFVKDVPYDKKIPDNMFMMILGENGVLGFLVFMVFLTGIFRKGLKYLNITSDTKEKYFVLSIMAALLAVTFNMLTYELLYWQAPFYLFWIFTGILASLNVKQKPLQT